MARTDSRTPLIRPQPATGAPARLAVMSYPQTRASIRIEAPCNCPPVISRVQPR